MGPWTSVLVFLVGLSATLLIGRLAARRKPVSICLAGCALLWFSGLLILLHRQDLLVALAAPVSLGDQILLADLWIAGPAAFIFTALGPWLPRPRDRNAIGVFRVLIVAGAAAAAALTAGWPRWELKGSARKDGICLQTSDYSCGAAAAATFLSLSAGIRPSEREMALACGVRPLTGVTMAGAWWGVEKTLRETGHRALLARTSFEELLEGPFPAMLSIRYRILLDHMVVLLGIVDGQAEIADPLQGKVRWPLEVLRERWRGEAILIVPRS